MKRIFTHLFLVLALAMTVSINADAATRAGKGYDGIYWRVDLDQTLVISGFGKMEDNRPAGAGWESWIGHNIGGKYSWAWYAYEMEKIQVETGITHIGASAFKSVSNLTTVKLPEKTAGLRIGSEAFACPNEDKAPFLKTMGAGANPQADQIILPEYVTELGSGCFYGNTAVTSVQISSKIAYIGEYTFDGCKSLENVTFTGNQSAVTSIGDCAFRNTLTDASFLQYLTKLKVIGTQHIDESVEKEHNDSKNKGRKIASLGFLYQFGRGEGAIRYI